MYDISIIIVNYNVKHFLDQCLRSVNEAKQHLNVEVMVVDNDSIDGSVEHIRKEFPDVRMFANKENVGFARANNQAIREAKGKFVLLLNPDTIIEKNTLTDCLHYMEAHPDCGALGVRMIDGEGKFLPESKRGFPTPFASLMRLTGLSKIFSKSKILNRYNLGYLAENEDHEIDVLCGAFMFMPREALDNAGLLDEQFFMYGEDIDLSYRIQKAGYTINYTGKSSIVHFKGESTRKSSLKYYSTFYNAMSIFAKKHYGGGMINPFLWMVNIAIFFIAVSNLFIKSISAILLPILEFIIVMITLNSVEFMWAKYYYHAPDYYEAFNSMPLYFLYACIWIFSIWTGGSYRNVVQYKRLFWGILGGSTAILILYGLMDNDLRHSRAIIIISTAVIFILGSILRSLFKILLQNKALNNSIDTRKVIVVGSLKSIEKVKQIMDTSGGKMEFVGALAREEQEVDGVLFIQTIERIEQVIEVYKIDEVLFSREDVHMSEIMKWMTRLGSKVKIKIISKEVQSIIGSHDRNSKGDLYTIEFKYNINLSFNRALKLILDYVLVLLILLVSPILFLYKLNMGFLHNLFEIIRRKKTFISYFKMDKDLQTLPKLPVGIIPPLVIQSINELSQKEMHSTNFYYARDYEVRRDLEIILFNFIALIKAL